MREDAKMREKIKRGRKGNTETERIREGGREGAERREI